MRPSHISVIKNCKKNNLPEAQVCTIILELLNHIVSVCNE